MMKYYFDFKNKVESVVRFRAKNYCNEQCAIEDLIDVVYNDIQTLIHLWWKYEYISIANLTDLIVIPETNMKDGDNSTITEIYGDVVDVTVDNISVKSAVTQVGYRTYRIFDTSFIDRYKDKQLCFIMPTYVPIDQLPFSVLSKIQPVIIEGVMKHIMESIPSPESAQLISLQEQRYELALGKLANTLPQVVYNPSGEFYGNNNQ